MKRGITLVGSMGLGASLMYLLDPDRGGRRRAAIRDRFIHLSHQINRALDITARDLGHRIQGVFAETWSLFYKREETDDDILVGRVRSKLGRIVSHPHAICVSAHHGRVILTGLILVNELEDLLSTLKSVKGVKFIENRLEAHERDENIPALQGGSPKPGEHIDFLQAHWSPSTRFLADLSGSALLYFGFKRKNAWIKALLAFPSLTLLLRSITNREIKQLLGMGRKRALIVRKIINVAAPVEKVFEFWSNFENFPKFMTNVREVRILGEGKSHWTIEGPAGAPMSWHALTTHYTLNQAIAWKSIPGSIIQNSGRVRFRPNEKSGTRVELDFSYNPPAGALGQIAAKIFGADPKSKLEEALSQMKTLLEEGPSKRQIAGLH